MKGENVQEIKIKDNPLGLKILINGIPDIRQIPIAEINVLISQMESMIVQINEKNEKRKKRNK